MSHFPGMQTITAANTLFQVKHILTLQAKKAKNIPGLKRHDMMERPLKPGRWQK